MAVLQIYMLKSREMAYTHCITYVVSAVMWVVWQLRLDENVLVSKHNFPLLVLIRRDIYFHFPADNVYPFDVLVHSPPPHGRTSKDNIEDTIGLFRIFA